LNDLENGTGYNCLYNIGRNVRVWHLQVYQQAPQEKFEPVRRLRRLLLKEAIIRKCRIQSRMWFRSIACQLPEGVFEAGAGKGGDFCKRTVGNDVTVINYYNPAADSFNLLHDMG